MIRYTNPSFTLEAILSSYLKKIISEHERETNRFYSEEAKVIIYNYLKRFYSTHQADFHARTKKFLRKYDTSGELSREEFIWR